MQLGITVPIHKWKGIVRRRRPGLPMTDQENFCGARWPDESRLSIFLHVCSFKKLESRVDILLAPFLEIAELCFCDEALRLNTVQNYKPDEFLWRGLGLIEAGWQRAFRQDG
jgi:hypothetical protein